MVPGGIGWGSRCYIRVVLLLSMSEKVRGVITWLYYRDLPRAQRFYEEVMGLELEVDQGWSVIYRIVDGAYVGLVDGAHGYHKANNIKPVILCLNVESADDAVPGDPPA